MRKRNTTTNCKTVLFHGKENKSSEHYIIRRVAVDYLVANNDEICNSEYQEHDIKGMGETGTNTSYYPDINYHFINKQVWLEAERDHFNILYKINKMLFIYNLSNIKLPKRVIFVIPDFKGKMYADNNQKYINAFKKTVTSNRRILPEDVEIEILVCDRDNKTVERIL